MFFCNEIEAVRMGGGGDKGKLRARGHIPRLTSLHSSKHQIQPEYGDEQADAGRDG